MEIEAILITHCHFDHIGAVAPVAARDRRARLLPGDRAAGARRHHELGAARVRPVRELRGRPHGRGRRAPEPGGAGHRGALHARPQPRALDLRDSRTRRSGCCSPATCSSRARSGASTCPGGDWATLERSIGRLLRAYPPRDVGLPGAHGRHDARAGARHQPVPRRAARARPGRVAGAARRRRTLSARKIKAPRGTFDVLGEQAAARATLEARARAILEGAGYERIETPVFEATELFARGVGASTDIVRKEMFTFEDAGGRSLTLRPEGTAPVCRAYVEHGMHKRRQPVKLWYLSSFFRHERAQAGRYRQFWQVGAEALGSEDPGRRRRVDRAAARRCSASWGCATCACACRASAAARAGPRTASGCRPTCARTRGASPRRCAARIELNPLRAFDSEHAGTRRVMAGAPRLLDHLDDEDAEHFAEVRALLDAARGRLRGRSDARARPRLLHAHRVRVHLRRARRAERRRRRGPLRRAGRRSSAGPAHARAWAGRPASSGSCSRASRRRLAAPRRRCELFVALGERRRAIAHGSAFALLSAGAHGRADGADGARRALAEGPALPRGRARRALRGDRRRGARPS